MSNFQPKSDEMQRFTALGRPFKDNSQENSFNTGMNSIMAADTFGNGNGPANTLPFRYTDDSVLMIPVLKVPAGDDVAEAPKKKSLFRRKSSAAKDDDFDMKKMTRGDYLKFYAKDEQGRFCGSEDPAPDCILKHPEDLKMYRGAK